VALSDTDIRVVGDVSAPTRAGAVLTDDPGPVVVELGRDGNHAHVTGLAADCFQFGGQRGAQPESAQPFDCWIEQASDSSLSAELPQRLVSVNIRHGCHGSRPIGIVQPMTARDALIASITGLVRRRGVAGTGLNALLEDSGVARRTVYLNFPGGKAELVTEATRIAGQALSAVIRSADDGGDPIQAVQTFIDQWKVQLRATEMEAGCPIVAAILGRSEAPAAAQAAAEAVDDWRGILADRLVTAGADPNNARSLATLVIAGIEGAVIVALASGSTDALDDVGRHLIEVIQLHLPTGAPTRTRT
jgi:TetR/AcrR family transcriptional regulator, lmrAB and yxaGH operons repressor